MDEGVVFFGWVEDFGEGVVGGELDALGEVRRGFEVKGWDGGRREVDVREGIEGGRGTLNGTLIISVVG